MYVNSSVQPEAILGGQSPSRPAGFTKEPINTATRKYYMSPADLSVPGKGLPFNLTRSYNSLWNVTDFSKPTHAFKQRISADHEACLQSVLFASASRKLYGIGEPNTLWTVERQL
jgi:hypothetical protein